MNTLRTALSLLLLALPAQAQGHCDCIDKADIKKRIRLATEAMNGYVSEMPKWMISPYTAADRDVLQARVEAYMVAKAGIKGLHPGAKGATSNMCWIEITAPTKCLEEAIRRHEQVHQAACEKVRAKAIKKTLSGGAADRFEAVGATMMEYMNEEIAGYMAEVEFLRDELRRLERDCDRPPPPGRSYSSPRTSNSPDAPPPPPMPPKPKPYGAPPLPKLKPYGT